MSTELTVVTEIPQLLAKAEVLNGLAVDSSASLVKSFATHFSAFYAIVEEAKAIKEDSPKAAQKMRMKVRRIRLDAEKTREELKADSLRFAKAVEGINHLLLNDLVPVEKALERIEKLEEIKEANRIMALAETRRTELIKYVNPEFYDLGNMPVPQYNQLLDQSKIAFEKKIAEDAAIEAKRIADEKAIADARAKKEADDAAEREKLKKENARLAKIAADAQKIALETQKKAAETLKAAQDKAAKEKADMEKKAADEKAVADAKTANDKALKEAEDKKTEQARKDADAKATKEKADLAAKAERIRLDAEAKIKAEQDKVKALEDAVKAKADEEAKKIQETKVLEQKALAATDKVKLAALSAAIRAIRIPPLSSKSLQTEIEEQFKKFPIWIDGKAAKL